MNLTSIESLPSGKPFASLEALRRQHSVLLRQRKESLCNAEAPQLDSNVIVSFLSQAKATGCILSDLDSRDAAQSILDYWSAVILSDRPDLSEALGALFPDDFDSANAPVSLQKVAEDGVQDIPLTERAKTFTEGLKSKEHEALARLLPKLVRLSAGTGEFYLYAMPASEASDDDKEEQAMLQNMLQSGLIRIEGEGVIASYVLTDISLIKAWPELRELCAQRRAFRSLARRWHTSSRDSKLLIESAPQLACAGCYRDMVEYETAFFNFGAVIAKRSKIA